MQKGLIGLIFDHGNKRSNLHSLTWYAEEERTIDGIKGRFVVTGVALHLNQRLST